MGFLASLIHTLESSLFPDRCAGGCGTRGTIICTTCRDSFQRTSLRSHGVTVAFEYTGALKEALHALKYENRPGVGQAIGVLLWEELGPELFEESPHFTHEKVILIPVPISTKRLRQRGYNQAFEIAKGFLAQNEGSLELATDVLYKIYDTESQVSVKNRVRRLKNIKNSFEVRSAKRIQGKTCIVIDDITTTGATLAEAKRLLQKEGARTVISIAVAH